MERTAEFSTLSHARHSFNLLHKRLERFDANAADRFSAFAEFFWSDQVSVEEAINDMRDILRADK